MADPITPDRLPQGVPWNDADLLTAYTAGAESGRKHEPDDYMIARSADAYVKLCHVRRLLPPEAP